MGTVYACLTHWLLTMWRLLSLPGDKKTALGYLVKWDSVFLGLLNPFEAALSNKTCSYRHTLSALPDMVTTLAATRQWMRGQCDQELKCVMNHVMTM